MKVSVVFLLLLISHLSYASTAISIHPDERYPLVKGVEFLMDESNTLEIHNIQQNKSWRQVARPNINFGFIKNTLWLRFKVVAEVDANWVLYISYPLLDHLESTSIINGKVGKTVVTGDQVKFSSRPTNNPGYVFTYNLSKSDELEVYLKVNTLGAAEVPLNLISQENFTDDESIRNFLWGWMNGIFSVMLLYNLFIYFVIREKVYLYYVLCVFSNIILLGVFGGTWFQYIWPNAPELNHQLFPIVNGLLYSITLLFVTEFLQIFSRKSWYRAYFKYLLIALFSLPVLSLIMDYQTIVLFEVFGALIMNASVLAVGVYLSFKGETLARLFTLAWSMFLFGLMLANLKSFGLLPSNWITIYAYQFGSFIEVTVLSMALAYRIDTANTARSKAQKENIQNLQRFQNLYDGSLSGQFQLDVDGTILNVNPAFYKMLGYSSESEILSLSKDERSRILNISKDAYQAFLDKLKPSSEMVVFEAKMFEKNGGQKWYAISVAGVRDDLGVLKYFEGSMIGINELKENEIFEIEAVKDKMVAMEHLVIGICHEMNTPLGIATTGISYLMKSNDELGESFKLEELTKSTLAEFLNEGGEAISLVDDNLQRLNALIKRFKKISILQSNYKLMDFNIKTVIDGQVSVLNHILKDHTVYVDCPKGIVTKGYPQALSFMLEQFLGNSVHHGFTDILSGIISISVAVETDDIVISYRDNGIGIPIEKHKKIFNPFYTTRRGASENIGLGMFQVYNIVTQLLKGEVHIRDVAVGFELEVRFPMKGV